MATTSVLVHTTTTGDAERRAANLAAINAVAASLLRPLPAVEWEFCLSCGYERVAGADCGLPCV